MPNRRRPQNFWLPPPGRSAPPCSLWLSPNAGLRPGLGLPSAPGPPTAGPTGLAHGLPRLPGPHPRRSRPAVSGPPSFPRPPGSQSNLLKPNSVRVTPQLVPAGWLPSVIQAAGEASPAPRGGSQAAGGRRAPSAFLTPILPARQAPNGVDLTGMSRANRVAAVSQARRGRLTSAPLRLESSLDAGSGLARSRRRRRRLAPSSWREKRDLRRVRTPRPWEICPATLSSRVAAHLIGCSAAPVDSTSLRRLPAAGASCRSLKSWYCKDPQETLSCRVLQMWKRAQRREGIYVPQVNGKARGVTLNSAPDTTNGERRARGVHRALADPWDRQ